MDGTLYSTELTPEEQQLGFVLMEVKNSRRDFAGQPPKVKAVVFKIGPSDRITKMNDPYTGGCSFKHQRYGYFGTKHFGDFDWHPVGTLNFPTAAQAVQMITSGKAEALESQMGAYPRVTAVDPGDDF